MSNRRLLFGVIVKILLFSGVIGLIVVLITSLFTRVELPQPLGQDAKPVTVEINVENMRNGEIRKISWQNRDVAILLRQSPDKLVEETARFQEKLHHTIQSNTRSLQQEYFVYIDRGDSRNCPLHYAAGIFKDICSASRFDETGRNINGNQYAYKLEIPPHIFKEQTLIIGRWE